MYAVQVAAPGKTEFDVVQDLDAGDVLTRENVHAIRSGLGLPPKYLDQLLGRKVSRAAARGTALSWDLLGEGVRQ